MTAALAASDTTTNDASQTRRCQLRGHIWRYTRRRQRRQCHGHTWRYTRRRQRRLQAKHLRYTRRGRLQAKHLRSSTRDRSNDNSSSDIF